MGRTGFKPKTTAAGVAAQATEADWGHFIPSVEQTTNLTAGNDVVFDVEKDGNETIPITPAGVFTLKAGKAYEINLGLGVSFAGSSGFFSATIYDTTNSVDKVSRAYATPVSFSSNALRGPLGHSFGAFTVGAADIECVVRITLSGTITKLYGEASGTRLVVREIPDPATSAVSDPGTADGQVAVWSDADQKYSPVPFADLHWDAATKRWYVGGTLTATPPVIGTDSFNYNAPIGTYAQMLALVGMTTGASFFVTDPEHLGPHFYNGIYWDGHFNNTSLGYPLTGVVDPIFTWIGERREIAANLSADYTTDFSVGSQHISFIVNAITTGGGVVITGTSLGESTAVPVPGDTETITLDTVVGSKYQSSKKWLEITNIDIGATTGLNYDIGVLGYYDGGNRKWALLGYRADMRTSSNTSDLRIILERIKDVGGGKFEVVTLEDRGHDSTPTNGAYSDNVRTGLNSRAHIMTVNLSDNNVMIVYKQLDFLTFFILGEAIIDGTKNEGVIFRLEGDPAGTGLSGIDAFNIIFFHT